MTPPDDIDPRLHPMRIVVQRTGLSPDLLRAWEKRYAVVTPTRSEGGQRLYSDADVARLALLTRAVNGGRAISQVAGLPMRELEAVVKQDEQAVRARPPRAAAAESQEAVWSAALSAVERFAADELQSVLRRAVLRLGIDEALDGVIGPLLFAIGSRWRGGALRPAHEHLASSAILRTLAWIVESARPAAPAPTVVVTTVTGQTHEVGAMLVAAAASTEGWRVTYLGTSLPADEIAVAASETHADAVAISLVYPADDPEVPVALRDLRTRLPATTAILAGGGASASYAAALDAIGAWRFSTTGELRAWLRESTVARERVSIRR